MNATLTEFLNEVEASLDAFDTFRSIWQLKIEAGLQAKPDEDEVYANVADTMDDVEAREFAQAYCDNWTAEGEALSMQRTRQQLALVESIPTLVAICRLALELGVVGD